jgi:hypothetical protein
MTWSHSVGAAWQHGLVRLGRPTAWQRCGQGAAQGVLWCSLCGLSTWGDVAKHRRSRGFHDEHHQTTTHAPGKAIRSTSPWEMTAVEGGWLTGGFMMFWCTRLAREMYDALVSYPVFMLKPCTHHMHDPGSIVSHIWPKVFTDNQMS